MEEIIDLKRIANTIKNKKWWLVGIVFFFVLFFAFGISVEREKHFIAVSGEKGKDVRTETFSLA